MSTKNKLYKFKENETFAALLQPTTEELLGKDYKFKGRWGRLFFGNDNPIVLELGCGKGEYTVQLAKLSPQKNFIGIDIKGARLWKGAKSVTEEKIPNAAFIRTRIEFIESLFGEGEISEIWITFADPQIKRARKRLTGTLFLKRYSHFLKPNGIVHLKTDSLFLYKYTLFTAEQNRLQIINSIQDLYGAAASNAAAANAAAGVGENLPEGLTTIRTFYEQYYIKNGFTIKYLSFRLLAEGNAAFIRTRIEFIESLFGEGEISEIWITFADPQIKRARKRLTGTLFLKRYSHFLKPNGIVHLKTDSLFLYKYTLFTAEQNRLQIINSIQDLYGAAAANAAGAANGAAAASNAAAGVGENLPEGLTTIRTFYEQYYIKNGFTIKYLSFRLLAEGNAASACEGAAPLSLAEPEWDEEYWRAEEAKGRENLVTNKGV